MIKSNVSSVFSGHCVSSSVRVAGLSGLLEPVTDINFVDWYYAQCIISQILMWFCMRAQLDCVAMLLENYIVKYFVFICFSLFYHLNMNFILCWSQYLSRHWCNVYIEINI